MNDFLLLFRGPTVLDTKCKFTDDSKCWYCNELCEICVEPIVLGPSHFDQTGQVLQFCSNKCYDFYQRKPELFVKIFAPDDQKNPDRRVPIGHKEYLHLSTFGESDDGHLITNISLCEGDGSESFPAHQYYLNYHLCTPKYQGHYEFFISDDLQALDSVSYARATHNIYEKHNEIAIKKLVLDVVSSNIRSFGASSVADFLVIVQLNALMGPNFGLLMSGKEDISVTASTEPPTSTTQSFGVNESEQEWTLTYVPDKDAELKPVIAATGSQLLSTYHQCEDDQSTLAEMVQNFFSAWNEHVPQDSRRNAGSGVVWQYESVSVEGEGAKFETNEECQQNMLEPDKDSQCKLQ